jgi:hypothetical protein
MMLIPHDDGTELVKIKFHMLPNIKALVPLPEILKKQASDLVFSKAEEFNAQPTETMTEALATHQPTKTETVV